MRFGASSVRIQNATVSADYPGSVFASAQHDDRHRPHPGRVARSAAAMSSRAGGLDAAVAVRPAARAGARQRVARVRDPRAASVGVVPVGRARDGAARPGAGRRDRHRVHGRRRRLLQEVARRARSPTSRTSPPSRWSAGWRSGGSSATSTSDYTDQLWFAAVVLCIFMATNALNFAMVAARDLVRRRRPDAAHAALVRHGAAVGVRDGAADRQRRVHVRTSRDRVGRPGRRRPVRLPLHPAHQRAGRGSRRANSASGRANSRRCRWGCCRLCCRRSRCATR